jgi:hypothetical protein
VAGGGIAELEELIVSSEAWISKKEKGGCKKGEGGGCSGETRKVNESNKEKIKRYAENLHTGGKPRLFFLGVGRGGGVKQERKKKNKKKETKDRGVTPP